jgi:hypothetical protein
MNIKHIPIRKIREDMNEAIYLKIWQNLNKSPLLSRILNRNRPSQRDAQVAASFVSWLGTGVGDSFLYQAKQRLKNGSEDFSESAYITAWAITNKRKIDNTRIIEFILSRDEDWHTELHHKTIKKNHVQISLSDLDVVESIIVWLSTSEGDLFINTCIKSCEIDSIQKRHLFYLENNIDLKYV